MQNNLKIISNNQPLCDDNFYKWLSLPENNPRKVRYSKDMYIMRVYLESQGFVIGQDILTEDEYQILDYVIEHWYRSFPPSDFIAGRKDLSPASKNDPDAYYVHSKGHYKISAELKKALMDGCGIYHLSPENYYIEIIGNRLYLKYTKILGSRIVCKFEN